MAKRKPAQRVFGYTDIHWSDRDERALAVAMKAQELFQQAAQVVGNLGRGAARQAEGQFGIDQFIESQALGNVREQRKIQRVLAGEQSDFSERGLFEVEDGTVKGLGRR